MTVQLDKPISGETTAVMTTTMGAIKIRLFPGEAPKTVENFVTHAKNGYYNGLIFHRVIKDFMIQGGDPTGTGRGGQSIWGRAFEDEFSDDLHNLRGSLSMANAGRNTNGSQFFIVQAAEGTPWLDFRHTVFGQVYEGMEVIDQIAAVRVGAGDKPVEDVKIISISIESVE
jgi:peptidyl-prolyl cis-trans isomerase B (cyclophilin B)